MQIKKKLVKITGWIVGSIVIVYLLLLWIAGIYINHQQKRILTYIADVLRPRIRGKLAIGSLDVSPWSSFPSIDFRLQNIVITDSLHQQPVLTLRTVSSSFSLFQLIRGKKVINNLLLENGSLHLQTDSTGYNNSFLKPDTSKQQQGSDNAVMIEVVRMKNIGFIISNVVKEKEISFMVNTLRARIDEEGPVRRIVMTEQIQMNKGLGFNLAKGAFLENQSINGQWDVQYNLQAQTLSFTSAKVAISQQPFILNGQFSFQKDNPLFRVEFATKQIHYSLAKAIVSDHIRIKLDQYKVQQPLDADGFIDGSLLPAREPAISINWRTSNNTLETEAGVFSRCSFTGSFMNTVDPAGAHVDSNSRIQFVALRADWNGIPFTADSVTVTNLDSARLQTHLRSDCKLEDVDNALGMQDIAFKSGRASADIWYDGLIVRDKSMLEGVHGTITIKDGAIDYTPRGFSFTNCNGSLSLMKDSIRMDDFNCRYGDNVFAVALYGTNLRKAFISGNNASPADLECTIRSPMLNMDDFSSLFGQAGSRKQVKKTSGSFAATARAIDAALDNSTVGLHVKAAAFKKGNMHATNFDALVRFEPNDWAMEKISMRLAGGNISGSGRVLHGVKNTHTAMFNVAMQNTDISKLLFAFDNFGQEAITSKELGGRFSTVASLQAGISSLGHIIAGTLKGDVDFSLQEGVLLDYEPLNRLKSFVFKNRDLRHVSFAELKNKLKIDGETIVVNRMEIQSSAFRLYIEGNYGLARRNTDLLIKVPFSNLNSNSFETDSTPVNKGLDKKSGAGIWLRAVNDEDGKVKVKLTMSKKVKATGTGTDK